MQIERDIKDIPLNSIDEIEWLKIRQIENQGAEDNNLTYLGLSMATNATAPAAPKSADHPTSWEDFLLRMPVGQLAPVRVIRYPHELQPLPKDYGLVFGYRRWHAAKQRGLTTIKAQVIHLSIEEYRDDKTKFYLLLMGFTENTEREPLSGMEYFKAVKRLKDKYETIYPDSSKRFKHLTQGRNPKGHFTQANRQAPPSFNKVLRKITKKSQRRIEEDVQLADLLNRAILDDRYQKTITKSAALTLARIPHDQQIAVLDQLVASNLPFTINNIETAIHKSQHQGIGIPNRPDRQPTVNADSALTAQPHNSHHLAAGDIQTLRSHDRQFPAGHNSLPDLTIVKAVVKLCLDLRHRFIWTPTTIEEALPIFDDLLSASQVLVDYLRHEKAVIQNRTCRTPTATPHDNNNGKVLKHVER